MLSVEKLFALPVPVLFQLLNEWVPVISIGRVDSAIWNSPQRSEFLRLLRAPEHVFDGECSVRFENYLQWAILRSVKISILHCPAGCKLIEPKLASSLVNLTGHCLKKLDCDGSQTFLLQSLQCHFQSSGSKLEFLEVSNTNLVVKILELCQNTLRDVLLRDINMTSQNVTFAMELHCPNMHSLTFQGKEFSSDFISKLLHGCPKLTHLSCTKQYKPTESQPGAIEGIGFIPALIHTNDNLQHLNVSDTYITDFGLSKIAHYCPNLTSLKAARCPNVSDVGIISLTTICRKIEQLQIDDNYQLTDHSLAAVAEAYSTTLTKLSIASCHRFTHTGLTHIARTCHKLYCLDMSDNYQLRDEHLVSFFEHCCALEELFVTKMPFSNKLLDAVSVHCLSLKRLYLDRTTKYSAEGIVALLTQAKNLQLLVVSSDSRVVNQLSRMFIAQLYPHVRVVEIPHTVNNFGRFDNFGMGAIELGDLEMVGDEMDTFGGDY